jgi:hypothetical protein
MPTKKDVVKKTEAAKRKMKKKPPAKKTKPKPKTKQKQTQTQNVIINLSDVRKRTRRKMTSSGGKRPLPLSSFSGSAQAPIYVNPHGSAYSDLIRPLKEHQREMRASAQNDLRRSDQQRELLRSDFKKSQAGQNAINKVLIAELRATKQRGNVEQVTPPPTAGDLGEATKAPTVGNLQDSDEGEPPPKVKNSGQRRVRTAEQKERAKAKRTELKAVREANAAAKAARDRDVEETDMEDEYAKAYTTTSKMRKNSKKGQFGDGA